MRRKLWPACAALVSAVVCAPATVLDYDGYSAGYDPMTDNGGAPS
jgi:hypothetical protein